MNIESKTMVVQKREKSTHAHLLSCAAILLGWLFFATEIGQADVSSVRYENMTQYCMTRAEIEQVFNRRQRDSEDVGYHNPLKGIDPDLESVRQKREALNKAIGGQAYDARNSFFFMLRGMLNIILGENIKALGDLSEANKVCRTAPVYASLSSLFSEFGFQEYALEIVDSISCLPDNTTLCDQKVASFILLDELGRAYATSNQNFLRYQCIFRMVIELLRNGEIRSQCDLSPSEIVRLSAEERFAYDVVTTGRLGVEYEEFAESADRENLKAYSSYYIALHFFRRGEMDKGCDKIKDVLEIKATAKMLLFEYDISRKIEDKICMD